jgi:hypothetical protein
MLAQHRGRLEAYFGNDAFDGKVRRLEQALRADQLDACCATTSAALRTQCQTVASQGMLAQCGAVLGIFCNGGTAVDGGTRDAGGGCAALQQCCAALSGIQRTQCETLAATGNDMNCDTVAFLYCP